MQQTSKWKVIIAPSIVAALMVICCLFCTFLPTLPKEVERKELKPRERRLATDYFALEITSTYIEKQWAWQIVTNPLIPKTIQEEVLILEITVTNHLPGQLDLICYIQDTAGYSYSPQFEANRPMFDTGSTFLTKFKPLETVEGRMEFYSLPDDSQELWFHCGLCDNSLVCVEGKLHDVAIQIR